MDLLTFLRRQHERAGYTHNPNTLLSQEDSCTNAKGPFYVHYGVREHAMGAFMNGPDFAWGLSPMEALFYVFFSDYMRPAIRLAAQ